MNYSPPIGGDFFISFLLWHIGYGDGHDRCGGALGATVVVGLYVRAWCQSKTNCCVSSAMAMAMVAGRGGRVFCFGWCFNQNVGV